MDETDPNGLDTVGDAEHGLHSDLSVRGWESLIQYFQSAKGGEGA